MPTVNATLAGRCRSCGWPVVHLCCNGPLEAIKRYSEWDWWAYCSNPTCEHHYGEGVFQDAVPWVERPES